MSARKSNAQKALAGTLRPMTTSAHEPVAVSGPPDLGEANLTESARKFLPWFLDLLAPTCKLSPENGPAFIAMLEDWAEMQDCREVIQREGRFFRTINEKTGCEMVRVHPAVGILAAADKRFGRYADQFGLTPATRLKATALLEHEPKRNPFDDI
jgi:P27 family predicted phage terminase small subunit